MGGHLLRGAPRRALVLSHGESRLRQRRPGQRLPSDRAALRLPSQCTIGGLWRQEALLHGGAGVRFQRAERRQGRSGRPRPEELPHAGLHVLLHHSRVGLRAPGPGLELVGRLPRRHRGQRPHRGRREAGGALRERLHGDVCLPPRHPGRVDEDPQRAHGRCGVAERRHHCALPASFSGRRELPQHVPPCAPGPLPAARARGVQLLRPHPHPEVFL
mmetsp:Transcript_70189/g.176860  ORF Transcript_70189/g.176860 Transcript_70189/m.176860 type:complete len:216 (+) Transcript_70189:2-649(+)